VIGIKIITVAQSSISTIGGIFFVICRRLAPLAAEHRLMQLRDLLMEGVYAISQAENPRVFRTLCYCGGL
jgi:hypothetical protein